MTNSHCEVVFPIMIFKIYENYLRRAASALLKQYTMNLPRSVYYSITYYPIWKRKQKEDNYI